MIVDYLNWLFTRKRDRAAHDAVAQRLRDDRAAWAERRGAQPSAEPAPGYRLPYALGALSMAAAVLIAVTVGLRFLPEDAPAGPPLDTAALSELNPPALLAATNQAAEAAFERQWQAIANDARAGLAMVLAPLPNLPETTGDNPS